MNTIAYIYTAPLLESPLDIHLWALKVDRVYHDLGKREQLQQLLLDCSDNPPDYLLVRNLEDLGDSWEKISDRITKLEALGIAIIATEQSYNLANLTQIQDNSRSRRIRQGHARNRIQGLPPPGKAPYGYRRGKDCYIIDRTKAPIVKDFFEQFLLFGSLRGAVRYLEKKYGKKIAVSTGRNWLINPVYRGDLLYQNNQVISDTHTPIISREEAAQIDRLLRRNSRLPLRTASAPRSLAGLVVCHKCGNSLQVSRVANNKKTPKEYLYLRSMNCPLNPKCKGIPYQQVLDETIRKICQDLPQAVEVMSQNDLDQVKAALVEQIKQKQEIKSQLPLLQEQGILDQETSQLRHYHLEIEISQLKAKLAGLPPVNLKAIADTVSIAEFWLDLSETERRFYFREFIQKIELIRLDRQYWKIRLVFIF